jgi:serine-type D-Ala-D-Ala endopeptidase (penicillin-binding protein 7)
VVRDFQRGMARYAAAVMAAVFLWVLPTSAHAATSNGKAKAAIKSATTAVTMASVKATGKTSAKPSVQPRKSVKRKVRRAPPRPPSFGTLAGLHATDDPLDLKSAVALVVDQDTDEVLFSKNPEAVLPIASITKLMTALVVTEAELPMDERLTVTQEDVRATAGANMRSSLVPGVRLTRGELLHLALMSSENRAASMLGRTYPGGMPSFIAAMNAKARELGMGDTRYVEPTGLSADNRSSAQDLAQLVRAAFEHPVLRELSTMPAAALALGRRQVQYRNTNGLVNNPEWEIGLQKTGYISAAGRCVVMQAELAGRKLIMVLLDSAGRYSRIGDAERLRKWIAEHMAEAPQAAKQPTQPAPLSLPQPQPQPQPQPIPDVHSVAWHAGAEGGRIAAPAPLPELARAAMDVQPAEAAAAMTAVPYRDGVLKRVDLSSPVHASAEADLRLPAYPR